MTKTIQTPITIIVLISCGSVRQEIINKKEIYNSQYKIFQSEKVQRRDSELVERKTKKLEVKVVDFKLKIRQLKKSQFWFLNIKYVLKLMICFLQNPLNNFIESTGLCNHLFKP